MASNPLIPNDPQNVGVKDDSYVSRSGHKSEPMQVISDEEAQKAVNKSGGSGDQLERDDKEAIDQSNILPNTRGASLPKGLYKEPGDTEGLPRNDGRSSV